MFHRARIKLTAWYFLVILFISVSFSMAIYRVLASELDRVERMQRSRVEHRLPILPPPDANQDIRNYYYLDPDLVIETKERLKLGLIVINAAILAISTIGGYLLAGKTLEPIAEMLEEQKRFTADASHELRTPLTAIKTEIEVALKDKKINLAQTKQLLKSNLEEVDRIQQLSNRLLSLSRYQNNNFQAKFETVNLKNIAEKAIENFKLRAKNQKIIIKKELKNTLIKGNETSLIELAGILLDNAIKYSSREGKIIIRTKQSGTFAILEVQDFGPGIDAKELPHIFDRFYRADSSHGKEKVDGYGLGLSIAKSIAELHQGKISATSVSQKGSKFTVMIPNKNTIFSVSSQNPLL